MLAFLQGLLIVLVVSVIFVNGWTDAPSAIACAVSTHTLSYRSAVRLAAACNLLGILVMSFASPSVASTIVSTVDFGGDTAAATAALCAAMAAIVLYAVAAWWFGIPTSESHALLAALAGAALALGGVGRIGYAGWGKVLLGLPLSLGLGYGLGFAAVRCLEPVLRRLGDRSSDRIQIVSAGAMAFMHGAQDGQKFIAVLIMAQLLSKGIHHLGPVSIAQNPLLILLCAMTMALGTSVGGGRIIATIGSKMVPLQKHQGACADIGGALCLLIASLSGIPMSTTHAKTAAILGAGTAQNGKRADRCVIASMLLAWAVTFPACGLIGWLLTKLLLAGLIHTPA